MMDSKYNSDNGDAAIFSQTNIAVWVLTSASGAFLAIRLWCRHRFSKLWWDDALLTLSWVCRDGPGLDGGGPREMLEKNTQV
jgi:hypothetical protein